MQIRREGNLLTRARTADKEGSSTATALSGMLLTVPQGLPWGMQFP